MATKSRAKPEAADAPESAAEGTPEQAAEQAVEPTEQAQAEPDLQYPNLAGVATTDLVDRIEGTGNFKPSYINWARTMHLMHVHAPGWLPDMKEVTPDSGDYVHRGSVGGFLMIRFKHLDGRVTPWVPQAIMDNRNNSIAYEKISARDVTDTQRRGLCLVAAQQFGLAYELWAKVELESGYHGHTAPEEKPESKSNLLSIAEHVKAINGAKDMDALQKAFALAWQQYKGDTGTQAMFKAEYDGRKIDLEEGGEA